MYLRTLTLHNFRLFDSAQFHFAKKLNLIQGGNARGKTTILEAIYYLMTGRSFRTAQSAVLIRRGAGHFLIEASFVKYGIEQKLCIYCNGKERKILYNNHAIHTQAQLGLLIGALMHPEDASIIKGAPSVRRQLLNLQLAQSDPLYLHYLMRYEQAMRQRNALLRAKCTDAIEGWEYEMSNAAAYIIQKRTVAIKQLEQQGKKFYESLCAGSEELSLAYKPHGASAHPSTSLAGLRQLFCDQYGRHRQKEMILGITLSGPHRDDFCISLEKQDARIFASEGQQRSCVAALRLAEWMHLSEGSTEKPLMLVDDFGLSLDCSRRIALIDQLSTMNQVFISSADQEPLAQAAHLIQL